MSNLMDESNYIGYFCILFVERVKMSNRKMDKVPLDAEWFKMVLRRKGVSVRSLGNADSENYVGWHEKTIRKAMQEGAISPKLLDAIGKKLDVYPPFLSGTDYAPALLFLNNKGDRDWLLKTYLSPERHPYSRKLQEDLGTYRHMMNTLLMHGVSEEQFKELDVQRRRNLFTQLDNVVTHVLLDFFENCRRMDDIDAVREWDWTSRSEVYDAMLPHWEETGEVTYDSPPDSDTSESWGD